MTAKVALKHLSETTIPIDLGEAGTFELVVKPPTIADEIRSQFAENVLATRIEEAVTDWRGLFDEEGKPVPFSTQALAVLTRQFPGTLAQIVNGIDALYAGPDEAAAKNSPRPSSTTSAPANAAAT